MSNQEFCRYCGNDTRGEHRDDCPAPDIERVEARLAEARGLLVNWMRLHTDDLAASTVPIGLAYQTQCFLAKREVPA